MRRPYGLFAFALAVAFAPLGWTQGKQDQTQRPDTSSKSAPASSKKGAPEGEQSGIAAGTKISAELATSLDARTAKSGDEVVARVTKNVKQDGRIVVRKGDRLLGHVTNVEANSSAQAGSQLAVMFDRLEQGTTITEMSTVVSQIFSAPAALPEPEPEMAPAPSMGQAPSGSSGGGSHGGLVGGATSTVGQTVNSTLGTAGSTVQGAGNTGLGGNATTQTLGGANGKAGLATPIANIHLASAGQLSNQNQATSVLSTKNGDLRINSGTRLEFRVAGQAEAHKPAK